MNAIKTALLEARYRIPIEMLNLAFGERRSVVQEYNLSLDEAIMQKVVRPRVLTACNIVGGVELTIPISRCNVTPVLDNELTYGNITEYIVTVPKVLTGGRSIVNVLSIMNPTHTMNNFNSGLSHIQSLGMSMVNNESLPPLVHTSRLELIAENVILVQQPSSDINEGVLRCNIENDMNLSNINIRSHLVFSKLLEYAIKSYIHNRLSFLVDQGYIYGGHELTTVNKYIDLYADAEEMYQDYLTNTWTKVAFMNDTTKHSRFISALTF